MRKLFIFIPAMLLSLAVNAATTNVDPGTGTLSAAIAAASNGDILVLANDTYTETAHVQINKQLTIRAAEEATPVIHQNTYRMTVNDEITIIGVTFEAGHSNELLRIATTAADKTITIQNCTFRSAGYGVKVRESECQQLENIIIDNCVFENIAYHAIIAEAKATAPGITKAISISNSTFVSCGKSGSHNPTIEIHDADDDPSTAGPETLIDHCTFYNCSPSQYTIYLHKIGPQATVSNCIVSNPSEEQATSAYYGYDNFNLTNCLWYNCSSGYRTPAAYANIINADPLFTDAANGDFSFPGDYVNDNVSPARGAATDGTDLGDPRWYTPATYPTTDFSGAGYVFTAAKAKLTAGTTIIETNESAPTHPYIRYTHSTPTGNAEWVIQATKACYVQATVNMVDNTWTTDPSDDDMFKNHKHVFVVEVRKANNALVGSVKEGDYNEDGTTDGWVTYPTVNLKGSIYIPEAGVYSVILKNYRNYSRCGVGSLTLAYAGGDVQTITNTADFETNINDAYFSANGSRADGKISFSGDAVASEWVRWNVTVANSDYYDITLNSAVESGHIYSVTFYDGETQVARVAESAWHNTTGALDLGRRFLPAGDYVMEIKNSVSSNSDAKIVSVGAVAFVAPVISLPNTLPAASAITSELAYEDGGELYFTPSDQRGHILEQWAKWKVSVAAAGAFLFTMDVNSDNEQSYKITILDSENNELDFFEKNPSSGARTIQHYFNLAAGNYFVMVQNTTNHSAGHIVSMVVSQPAGIVTIDEAATSTDSWADKVVDKDADGPYYDVQIIRTIKAGMYNTLCLPFAVTSTQCKDIFGADVQIRTLESSTIEEGDFVLNLNFKVASDIYQGTPILIQTSRDIVNPVFTEVKFTAAAPATSTTARANFVGNFVKGSIPASENNLFMGANNTLYFPTVYTEILGMRGYFVIHDAQAGVIQRAQIVEADAPAVTTDINRVEVNASVKTIENGQLVIIRDGKKYNVMGVRMK